MNIFYLDRDPYHAAKQLCDIHVNKMIIESAQMLSAAHHVLNPDSVPAGATKVTHKNHPSAVWMRLSASHYEWLYQYTLGLCEAYTRRTGKLHKIFINRLPGLAQMPQNLPYNGFSEPPKCMPDCYKDEPTTIHSYRAYLNAKYKEWLTREKPLKVTFSSFLPSWVDIDSLTH